MTINALMPLPSPDSWNAYVAAVLSFPMLEEKEESLLIHRWIETEDHDSAQKLVLSHLRLVVKVVRGYLNYGLSPGDLAQEGTIGLMKAVRHFDPSKGFRLAAYAVKWIEAEIRHYVMVNWRMVKLGTTNTLKKLFFGYRKMISEISAQGRLIKEDDLKKEFGATKEELALAESYFYGGEVSINEGDTLNILEVEEGVSLEMNHFTPPDIIVAEEELQEKFSNAIASAIKALDPRQKRVFLARRLIDNPVGLSELSKELGVSMERVRQIEQQAFNIVKERISSLQMQ